MDIYSTLPNKKVSNSPCSIIAGDVRYERTKRIDDKYHLEKWIDFIALLVGDMSNPEKSFSFRSKFLTSVHMKEGIDMIEITIHRDYINEHSFPLAYLKNGPVTLHLIAEHLHIRIHREYIDIERNVLSQIQEMILKLLEWGMFQVPLKKMVKLVNTGEVIKTQEYSHIGFDLTSIEGIFSLIMSKVSLSKIEVFYDIEGTDTFKLFNVADFYVYRTSFYSKDYKFYKSCGLKRKSLMCLYDKTTQMKEVKILILEKILSDWNLDLVKRFSEKMFKTLDMLDGTYWDFLHKIQPQLIKKLNNLNVNFDRFYLHCEIPDSLRSVLDQVVGSEIKKKYEESGPEVIEEHRHSFLKVVWNKIIELSNIIKLKYSYVIKSSRKMIEGSSIARGP